MPHQYYKPTVKVKWVTPDGDQMIADMARVSVQNNEGKPPEKLIAYMLEHGHSSPFDMTNLCVEVEAPRDISRQILRHWSIHPQERSFRYSELADDMFVLREARMQHQKNKQMSVDIDPTNPMEMATKTWWEAVQRNILHETKAAYAQAISRGVAREQARTILPEGNTMSRMYLNGTVRSWIFYLKARQDINATQREHVWVADKIAELFQAAYPITYSAFFATPAYEMINMTSRVPVLTAQSADDVRRWAESISEVPCEVLVSFQPNHSHCRVTWITPQTRSWSDYDLVRVEDV